MVHMNKGRSKKRKMILNQFNNGYDLHVAILLQIYDMEVNSKVI